MSEKTEVKKGKVWFEVTCDLFFWEGERSHCFMHWGNKRDNRFKYRELHITHHRSDLNIIEIVTVHYAAHNPIDPRSYNRMIETVLRNMRKLHPGAL